MTMTTEQIDAMQPGPALDAVVLVTVCGWRRVYKALKISPAYIIRSYESPQQYECIGTKDNAWNEVGPVPDDDLMDDKRDVAAVSQSWSDMLLVVKAMTKRGDYLTLIQRGGVGSREQNGVVWEASFRVAGTYGVAGDAPEAVCRAALRACMKENQ